MSLSEGAERTIRKCKQNSERGINRMRELADDLFGENNDEFIIGINGSFARSEVTSGSDVDLFFLSLGETKLDNILSYQVQFFDKLKEHDFKPPSPGGVFEQPLHVTDLYNIIGGMSDDNLLITRRMLLLLEGDWIHNETGLNEAREELIRRYMPNPRDESHICMFLLNDIIRYWRTICVDFEYKVRNGEKPRAIRLAKLRFSRMMLYFGGVIAVGETGGLSSEEKINRLSELLRTPTIERVRAVLGDKVDPALELYADFLSDLDSQEVRAELELDEPDGTASSAYESLREKAQQFRLKLRDALYSHYDESHSIRTALIL